MIDFFIRPCTANDQGPVIDLWAAAGLTRPWNDPAADFSRAISGLCSAVLVGISDGSIVSCVMVGEDGHRGWVYYLGVQPDLQGNGFGKRTLQAAEGWLRTRGVEKVNLLVRSSNAAGQEFYEEFGYRCSDVVCLQKPLTD